MKKIKKGEIAALLFLLLFFSQIGTVFATPAIYDNPGQGLFQCHANNNISPDFVKGGGVIVRWDLLQPQDKDSLDQTELRRLVNAIRGHKKSYVHFMLFFPNGVNGKSVFPSWLASVVQKVTYPSFKGADWAWTVAPWDETYREKLENFLSLLHDELKKAEVIDSIEYIEPSAGGMWGSTNLYMAQGDLNSWVKAAGCGSICDLNHVQECECLGKKFTEGVNDVFDIYMASFPELPMMMIGGNCLHTNGGCDYSGFKDLSETYGMRIMYKEAGLGRPVDNNCGIRPFMGDYLCKKEVENIVKCGQEAYLASVFCGGTAFPNDPESGCSGYKQTFKNSLSREKPSYYCLYSQDINCTAFDTGSNEKIVDINRWVAGTIGSQIFLTESSLDSSQKMANEPLTISLSWQNKGSAPLIAPLKQGEKWVPSSYKLFVEFVKDDKVKHYDELDLDPPTRAWPHTYPKFSDPSEFTVSTKVTFNIPPSLADKNPVVYKVYIGLTDPNEEGKRFALRNTDSRNDLANRRYLLTDSFTVSGQGACPSKEKGNLDCSTDEKINNNDLILLLSNWNVGGSGGSNFADVNGDSLANEKDLTILLKNWKN